MSLEKAMAILEQSNSARTLTPKEPIIDSDAKPKTEATISKGISPTVPDGIEGKIVGDRSTPPAEEIKTEETLVEEAPVVPEPKVEEPKPQEKVSEKFAAAVRREKALVKQMELAKAKEAELTERESKVKSMEMLRTEASRNPIKALAELGITYKQITDYVLGGEKVTPDMEVRSVRQEFEDYKRQQEEKEKKAVEQALLRQQQDAQRIEEEFQEEISDYLTSNAETYELINLNQAKPIVYQKIREHFQETKRILGIKEASDLVEKYLEDQVQKNLETKKWKAKSGALAKPKPTEIPPKDSANQTRTLTNNMTSSAPSFLPAKTEQERMQRALAALNK